MPTNRLPLSALLALVMACDPKGGTRPEDTEVVQDDADADSILDIHEDAAADQDPDQDGTVNRDDLDSDGDSINDKVEAGDADYYTLPVDSDDDGVPDYLDLDADNNCVTDQEEKGREVGVPIDTDLDLVPDFRDLDNDGDGIKDVIELQSCSFPDSDGDMTPDYMDIDSDGDGVGDLFEGGTTEFSEDPKDSDHDGVPDYLDEDSDNDGFLDSVESGGGDPTTPPRDIDGDGIYDFRDLDSDGDGIDDDEEASHGTDPFADDSDGDGFSDGAEVAAGTDPTDPLDVIDGLYVIVPERSSVEEVFEFELRIDKAGIAWLLDTTCSMSSTAGAMASEFNEITTELQTLLPDAQYGFATYDDYPYGDYGTPGTDDAFLVRQQLTDDYDAVQDVLTSVPIHYGNDWAESSFEALYQAATGKGYDMDCDGLYDVTTDVLPFISDPTDAFNGTSGQTYNSLDESTGQIGGMGWREFELPIILYATDAPMRDPENGYGTPGGCPQDAGFSDVEAAVNELGAYVFGIGAQTSAAVPQMEELAHATASYADLDGDSIVDPLVVTWMGSNDEFREQVVGAITDLVDAIAFNEVTLAIEGDEWGFVSDIEPDKYTEIQEFDGEVIDFVLTFLGVQPALDEDQLFKLTLQVLGDNSILLAELDIIVLVPGTDV